MRSLGIAASELSGGVQISIARDRAVCRTKNRIQKRRTRLRRIGTRNPMDGQSARNRNRVHKSRDNSFRHTGTSFRRRTRVRSSARDDRRAFGMSCADNRGGSNRNDRHGAASCKNANRDDRHGAGLRRAFCCRAANSRGEIRHRGRDDRGGRSDGSGCARWVCALGPRGVEIRNRVFGPTDANRARTRGDGTRGCAVKILGVGWMRATNGTTRDVESTNESD